MLLKISSKARKVICVVLFSMLILLFVVLIFLTIDSKKIIEIKEFISADKKILYITSDDNLNYPAEVLDKYSVDYLKINSKHLNMFERKKLKNIVNKDDLTNLILIYSNGDVVDVLIEYLSEESVNKFFQENGIIPEILVENVEQIMEESNKLLENTYSMIYIPYKNSNDITNQDKIFRKIANKHSIDYKKIDAYLLSNHQQEKINSLLGLSMVEDQILILIKDNKMIANIRGVHSYNTYIERLYDVNFINELEDSINKINYNEYKEILSSQSKNIIFIGYNDAKDTNDVLQTLNQIIYSYDISVNQICIDKDDTYLYGKIKEKIENIGYSGGFSLPLVVIVESNKVLDYSIGNSKLEYYLDIFIENGIIKGDVINE